MPEGDDMGGITLTASTRNSLLSVQNTNKQMATTQRHLESGRAVDSAIDDAVRYFKSIGLTDRAQDFTDLKSNMDQNISMIKAGMDGLTAIDKVYKQIKGMIQTAKQGPLGQLDTKTPGAPSSDIPQAGPWYSFSNDDVRAFGKQVADLLIQVDYIAEDASYQGQNMIRPDPSTPFTTLTVGHDIRDVPTAKTWDAQYPDQPQISLEGKDAAYPDIRTLDPTNYFDINKNTGFAPISVQVSTNQSDPNSTINIKPIAMPSYINLETEDGHNDIYLPMVEYLATNPENNHWPSPIKGNLLDNVDHWVDKCINYVRAAQASFGGTMTLLQSKVNFISDYTNTLQEGSDKMTLADLNEEGANLVACETRQQIGIQSVAISGQQQSAIMTLFR